MADWTFSMGIIAVMIVVLGVFAIIQSRKAAEIRKKHPGYPKGYWLNRGLGIGIGVGLPIGIALQNIAVGIAIGVAMGIAIGSGKEKKHRDEMRPITEEEAKLKFQSILVSAGTLLFGIIVFMAVYFLSK